MVYVLMEGSVACQSGSVMLFYDLTEADLKVSYQLFREKKSISSQADGT